MVLVHRSLSRGFGGGWEILSETRRVHSDTHALLFQLWCRGAEKFSLRLWCSRRSHFPTLLQGEWGGGGRGNGPSFRSLQSYAPQLFHQKASDAGIKIIQRIKVRDRNSALGPFAQTFCSVLAFSIHDEQKNIYLTMIMMAVLDRSVIFVQIFVGLGWVFSSIFGPLAVLDRSAEQNWFCWLWKDGVAAGSAPSPKY